MRTLTNVELSYVSGGESPCYALKGNAGCSPSTPGMSARARACSRAIAPIPMIAARTPSLPSLRGAESLAGYFHL